MIDRMPRLVYLASRLERDAIKMPRDIRRYVPNFDLYEEVAKNGLEGAAESLDIPRPQMHKLTELGRVGGKGSPQEFRLLIAKEVMDNEALSELAVPRRLGIMSLVDRYVNGATDNIIETDEAALNTTDIPDGIPKFLTGFTPLDTVLGGDGCYQGILMFMAQPGEGKTSTMVSVMEWLKRSNPDWQMLFFEQEIPLRLMLARMKPVMQRVKFGSRDMIICGQMSIEEIIKRLSKPPINPDRVVFIDSPDAMPGLGSDNTTRELGHIFRQLVKIKETSCLVVVSTQPNRRVTGPLTKASPANSWEKVWYVDMMVSVAKMGTNKMRMHTLKNRFGIEGTEVFYQYDLRDFTFDPRSVETQEDDWSDVNTE